MLKKDGDHAGRDFGTRYRASDGHESWGTVGVSTNVVEASWRALVDSFEFKLAKDGVAPTERMTMAAGVEGGEEQIPCPM